MTTADAPEIHPTGLTLLDDCALWRPNRFPIGQEGPLKDEYAVLQDKEVLGYVIRGPEGWQVLVGPVGTPSGIPFPRPSQAAGALLNHIRIYGRT